MEGLGLFWDRSEFPAFHIMRGDHAATHPEHVRQPRPENCIISGGQDVFILACALLGIYRDIDWLTEHFSLNDPEVV